MSMIDVTKLSPETIITDEMLEPQQGERILVMEHPKTTYQGTRYAGISEFEANRAYYNIKHKDKIMIRANVTYSDLFKPIADGQEFILSYETIEVIKGGILNPIKY